MKFSVPATAGRAVRIALVAGTFLLCLGLAAFPLRTWYVQRGDLGDARDRNQELVESIAEADARIAAKTDDEGMRHSARCFSHFVEPGEELYAVPGVGGCVTAP